MKTKKGDWYVEEIAKLIVAVVLLFLLGYLAFSLYQAITQKSELEQARVHIENIENIIKDLKEGEKTEYILLSPKGWYLHAFNINIPGQEKNFPAICKNKKWDKCVCFCPGLFCDKQAECKEITQSEIFINPVKFTNPDTGEVTKEISGYIQVDNLINFRDSIEISLNNGIVRILHKE